MAEIYRYNKNVMVFLTNFGEGEIKLYKEVVRLQNM